MDIVSTGKPEEKAYMLADGDGIILLVHPKAPNIGGFCYCFGGKEKMSKLKKYPEVSLVDAKARRDEACNQLVNGSDFSEIKKPLR